MSESEGVAFSFEKWFEFFYAESPRLVPAVIPDIIIWNIFLCLGVKDLLRVKCVCKLWNSIISNPLFVKNHLRRSIEDPTLTNHYLLLPHLHPALDPNGVIFLSCSIKSVFNEQLTCWEYLANLPLTREKYRLLGCCHSFMCYMSPGYKAEETHLRLCNPSTRVVSQESPSIGFRIGRQMFYSDNFLRRERGSMYAQQWDFGGFGYDSASSRYKAVLIFRHRVKRQMITAKVYSFGSTSWTTYTNLDIRGCSEIEWDSAFLASNNTLNWLAVDTMPTDRSYSLPKWTDRKYLIVAFDLTSETAGNISLPTHFVGVNAHDLQLGVIKQRLSIFHDEEQSNGVHIWIMRDYGVPDSWANMMSVSYAGDPPPPPTTPVCMSDKEELLLWKSRIMVYNRNTNTMRYPAFQPHQNLNAFRKHYIYIEGLSSPHF